MEAVKKALPVENKEKPRLSFGKNQKLNFIFGGNLPPKLTPLQTEPCVGNPLSPTNLLTTSEIATPKINILPNIRTVNIELEHQESPAGSLPESTYEEIDMRTDQDSEINNEKSVENNSDLQEEPELDEVKKKLNEIAKRVCNDSQAIPNNGIDSNDKNMPTQRPSECQKNSAAEGKSSKNIELVERAIKKLNECKSGIKLLHDFSENLAKLDNATEIPEKEKRIHLKMSIAHMQQAVQEYNVKSIEEDIEFLKGARNNYDKESVATSATCTITDTPRNELSKKAGKYQMQVGKIHLENSMLRKVLMELESNLKGGPENSTKNIKITDTNTQTGPEVIQEFIKVIEEEEKTSQEISEISSNFPACEQKISENESKKLEMLQTLVGLSKQRKNEELAKFENLKHELEKAKENIQKYEENEKKLTASLLEKDNEILKLKLKPTLGFSQSCIENFISKKEKSTSKMPMKNSNQLAALASIMISKSESINKDYAINSIRASNLDKKPPLSYSNNNAGLQKECLRRMISLKAVARTMFNLLCQSAKVFLCH